jgi:hypothetical protein
MDVTCSYSDLYDFEDDEVADLDELGVQHMSNIDWEKPSSSASLKVALLSSPMGTGKMHQLEQLADTTTQHGMSVLVVTHRQMLVTQLAHLFRLPCYDTLEDPINQYDSVVYCLNLIYKISEQK